MSAILDTEDIADLEGVVKSASLDSILIERPSYGQTVTGTRTTTWSTIGTFAGRIIPAERKRRAEDLQKIAEEFQVKELYFIQLPTGTDVRPDDRLTANGSRVLKVLQQTDNGNLTIRELPLAGGVS